VGQRSSFQNTLLRIRGLRGAVPPVIVTGAGHVHTVESQLRDLASDAVVLVEPAARDSAAAMAAAMRWIEARDPAGIAVILASDHHVGDEIAFRAALEDAIEGARQGHIVTLGVRPSHPSSAYGYIEIGGKLGDGELRRVARFIEKPDLKAAGALIAQGNLWNSGNFVASARVLIDELDREAPEVLQAATQALEEARSGGRVLRLSKAFLRAPKISIDYAVMEKTDLAAVLPVSCGWSDLGAWDAVWAASAACEMGNVVHGDSVLDDTSGCLIRAAPGQLVTAVGVRNLAIIADHDAVLVCDLLVSQSVKRLVASVQANGHPQVDVASTAAGESAEEMAAWLRRWLDVSALPLWWTLGADHQGGGFFEALDENGHNLDLPRRSRVQTRQTFVYAQAGAMGWRGPWREAMAHGAEYTRRAFVRRDGLHRTLVSPAGEPLDDTAWLYDQAFALLALAAQGADRETEAAGLMAAVERQFRRPGGGFAESAGARFVSNPIMHLFEAMLAWAEVGRRPQWRALAEEIADFAADRLFDPRGGCIAEVYDRSWRARDDTAEGQVWPGHQFEWAWLFTRWAGLGGGEETIEVARRLYSTGRRGIHPQHRVAMNALGATFEVVDATARLWPQTEWLKAARALADLASPGESEALRRDVLEASVAIRRYLQTPAQGFWRDLIDGQGALVAGPAPASSFYHLIGAIRDLGVPRGGGVVNGEARSVRSPGAAVHRQAATAPLRVDALGPQV